MKSAQLSFPEVPRLTLAQVEALDYFDAVLARPEVCCRMNLEADDVQLSNNHSILHSRTDYIDHEEPDRKRRLLRLWQALPDAQPLPASWKSACKDVDARAVRGGFRDADITREVESFEQRMASRHGMHCRVCQDRNQWQGAQA